MPVFRYFIFVGGALLALLFVVNLALPEQAADRSVAVASSGETPLIRIRSERKLPERVVIDTSQPTIAPPVVKTAAVVAPQPQQAAALAELSAKARVRETFAQFVPPDRKPEAAAAKTDAAAAVAADAKPQPKRKVARSRYAPYPGRPMMLVAQQPHFGPWTW
jgi:hypothetical protein